MTDEKPTPPGEGAPAAGDDPRAEAPAASAAADADADKAAKIAAAKAKAAALKAAKEKAAAEGGAEAPAEPKPPWEEKPQPPAHEEATGDGDVTALGEAMPGSVLAADRFAGDVTVTVPRERVLDVCTHLKGERDFTFLVDLTAVDWPEREAGRFDVVYWMHRFSDSKRLRVVAAVGEGETVASVAGVWRTANWMEREVFDMFGITFAGHPNLERILTWEGFNGHPLRKDFPVEGIDTGAAIYPDVYPPGGGPVVEPAEGGDEA